MAEAASINIGRIFGRGFDALGRNALVFFPLAVLLGGLPSFVSQYWVMSQTMGGPIVIGSPGLWFLTFTLFGMFVPIATGALLQGFVALMVIRQIDGRPAEAASSILAGLNMVVPLVVLSILVGLIVTIGLLLVVVPGLILYLVLIVAVPAMVAERSGVMRSMVRSEALTSGSKGMIFLVVLLLYLLTIPINLVAGTLGPPAIDIFGPGFVAPALTGAVAETFRSALHAAIVVSLYVELRRVKEGSGEDALAEVFA
jgi:hypothetical protein